MEKMEKKSLGRGLDDISDIFSSTRKNKKILSGFSTEKLRDATCESCANIIMVPGKAPSCKIFTFENKNYGVRYMDTISPTSASYCEHFEPVVQKNSGRGFAVNKSFSDNTEPRCEIEEHVIVRKNIAYPDTLNSQQYILKLFSKYLEEKYRIKSIELRKTDRKSSPGMKKQREEKITIFIHGNDN